MRMPFDYLTGAIATVLATVPFLSTAARADITSGFDLSGNVEYTTNPYLQSAPDTGAVRGRVTISPFIEERTARSTLRVAADASFSAFSRRYRDAIDLNTQVDYRNMLTRQLSIRAGVALNSSIGSSYGTFPIFGPVTTPGVVPPIVDLTVIGFQDRTTLAQASAGATLTIDDRNTIALDYNGTVVRYPASINRSEYGSIGQVLAYSRVLNSRVTVGASVGVTRSDFRGGRLGDAVTINPQITGSMRISAPWTLSGALGVSLSTVNVPGGRVRSNNLSGNLSFCRIGTRTNACLNASRSTAASSFEGLRTTTTFGASYRYRLNARDTLAVSGGYSKSVLPENFVSPTSSVAYVSGSASYSRRFSDRLSGTISAGYSQSEFVEKRRNSFASIGINYSFGNR
jgi:hypothetical protein